MITLAEYHGEIKVLFDKLKQGKITPEEALEASIRLKHVTSPITREWCSEYELEHFEELQRLFKQEPEYKGSYEY